MSEFNMYFPPSPQQERRRESFASSSPARSSVGQGTDRYIPNRQSSNLDDGFSTMHQSPTDGQENNELMNSLIMSELLGYSQKAVPARHSEGSAVMNSPPSVFSYQQRSSPISEARPNPIPLRGMGPASSAPRRVSEPVKCARKIKRLPYKILDAPALQDDFYLNLVDWSYRNTLAVGLGASVYLWAASTAKIQQLCDLGDSDAVSSVQWMYEGTHLAVGTNLGRTLIYDVSTKKMLSELAPHAARVGSLAWCGFSSTAGVMSGFSPSGAMPSDIRSGSLPGMANSFSSAFTNNNNNPIGTGSCSGLLASGSRDKHIFLHDPRIRSFYKNSPDVVTPHSGGSVSSSSGSEKTMLASQLRQNVPHFPSLNLPDADFDFSAPLSPASPRRMSLFASPPTTPRSMSTSIDDDTMDVDMYLPSEQVSRTDVDHVMMSIDDVAEDGLDMKPPSFPHHSSPAPAASLGGSEPWDCWNLIDEDNNFGFSGSRHSAPGDSSSRPIRDSPFSTPTRSSFPAAANSSGSRGRRASDQSVYSRYPSFTPPRQATTPNSRQSTPSVSPAWGPGVRPGMASPGGSVQPRSRSGSFVASNTAPPSPPPTVPAQPGVVSVLSQHRQEVCGLKWSFDGCHLASGGNDNKLCVWSPMHGTGSRPVHHFSDHTAAVKAIAWSPHQQHILASGGGTADRHIRFWNTATGQALQKVDTGSQVCNLVWSTNVPEIVSTHGYSLNQIVVWKYPSMQKLATLTGHTYRVLYLALSPDGQTIVTGAGDETLRFWNVFPSTKVVSVLLPGCDSIR